jgi:CBS domain-containing protein
VEVRSFLRDFPPFDALDDATLDRVVDKTTIEFFPAAAVILRQTGEPAKSAYVVRTGAVELLDGDRLVDLLHPGELFGHPSMLARDSPSLTARAHEDTLCYLVAASVMQDVFASRPGLVFLSRSLRERLTHALERASANVADPWRRPLAGFISRPLVTCPATSTVRDAARRMADARVSSLLVQTDRGWGIVTDRDLRTRVIAEGLSVEATIDHIVSRPLTTVEADALAVDALRLMLERGIHHVPIVDRGGRILGVITDTDLMGLERRAPFMLRSEIERADSRDAVIAAGRKLPATVADLVDARLDPDDIGHVVGVTVDALTRRLAELAVTQLGDPPLPWAWIALGSQARHEQSLRTDQDHALALADNDAAAEVEAYFSSMAEWVTSAIEAVGIPRCRAGVSATETPWRATLSEWSNRFAGWMAEAGANEAALTAIAFDYRRVAGPLDVEPVLDGVVRSAPTHRHFLRRLVAEAITLIPPTGFVRDFVVQARGDHAGTLDIKHGGLTAITSIARILALDAGVVERRTLNRLGHSAVRERLDPHDREGLCEAFRLLWQVRLEHQVSQSRGGDPPDDFVDPKKLGPVTRQGVKEAFRMIDRVQRALALEFGVRRA